MCVGSIKLVIASSSQHVDTFTLMSFVWMKNVVIECALNAILISANTSQILAIAYLELFKDKLNNLERVENDENFTTKYSKLLNKKKIQSSSIDLEGSQGRYKAKTWLIMV